MELKRTTRNLSAFLAPPWCKGNILSYNGSNLYREVVKALRKQFHAHHAEVVAQTIVITAMQESDLFSEPCNVALPTWLHSLTKWTNQQWLSHEGLVCRSMYRTIMDSLAESLPNTETLALIMLEPDTPRPTLSDLVRMPPIATGQSALDEFPKAPSDFEQSIAAGSSFRVPLLRVHIGDNVMVFLTGVSLQQRNAQWKPDAGTDLAVVIMHQALDRLKAGAPHVELTYNEIGAVYKDFKKSQIKTKLIDGANADILLEDLVHRKQGSRGVVVAYPCALRIVLIAQEDGLEAAEGPLPARLLWYLGDVSISAPSIIDVAYAEKLKLAKKWAYIQNTCTMNLENGGSLSEEEVLKLLTRARDHQKPALDMLSEMSRVTSRTLANTEF